MINQKTLEKIGCTRDPFAHEINSPDDIYVSMQHRLAYAKMLTAANNNGFIAVIGAVGAGKTLLKSMLKNELAQDERFRVSEPVIIQKKTCTPNNILDAMYIDFNHPNSIRTNFPYKSPVGSENKARRVSQTLYENFINGKKCVLIIDEAHDLPVDTFRSLKRFYELQSGFNKLISIILIGQPEMTTLLNNFQVREVASRLEIVQLHHINNVIRDYIIHKVRRAGGDASTIFDDSAYQAIEREVEGNENPLAINNICAGAIIKAHATGIFPVTAETVELVMSDNKK